MNLEFNFSIFKSPEQQPKQPEQQISIRSPVWKPHLSKLERHRLRMKERKKKAKQGNQNQQTINPFHNVKFPSLQETFPCLLVLAKNIPVSVLIHFTVCPKTFLGRRTYIQTKTAEHLRMYNLLKKPFLEQEFLQMTYWFEKEQRCRVHFLQLLQHWLYKRYKDRMLNTTDPVTMITPQVPIYLFDVKRRGSYVFEASCLKKRIESELFYSEWMFPQPKHPKNPLTNLEFTESQRISLLHNLREKQYGSWIYEAYRIHGWNLETLKLQYAIPLKLESLNDLIRNPTCDDTIEYLQEFIEKQYRIHKLFKAMKKDHHVLNWGAEYAIDTPYIRTWLKIFKKYYSYTISHSIDEHDDINQEDLKYIETIEDETKLLLVDTISILELHEKYTAAKGRINLVSDQEFYIAQENPILQRPRLNSPTENQLVVALAPVIAELDIEECIESERRIAATTIQRIYRGYYIRTFGHAPHRSSNPIERPNHIVISLPDGTLRIIYSLPTDRYRLLNVN
jgi:hypothetical protein